MNVNSKAELGSPSIKAKPIRVQLGLEEEAVWELDTNPLLHPLLL